MIEWTENPKLKAFVKSFLPPIFLDWIGSITGRRSRWTGDYPDWASAVAASSGYEADAIFTSVRKAAAAVRDNIALWERDSTCFYHDEYNWQLLACLMTVAAQSKGALHVLDFGGALGSTYMQHRKLLSSLSDCSWNVVEQAHVVACGKFEFTTEALHFFDTIEHCFAERHVNAVLFSSVLQYLENPYDLLESVMKLDPVAIIIDRTPIATNEDQIMVQTVPSTVYRASYPCHFLDKARVEAILKRHGTLTPWFTSPVDPPQFYGVMSLRCG